MLLLSPGVLAVAGHFAIVFFMALPNPNFFDVFSMLIGMVVLAGYGWMVLVRARRQAVFAIVGDQLLVMDIGVLGSKRFEWDRSELYDVRSGEVLANNRKTKSFELQIWKRDGKKAAFLAARDADELRWMATVLRRKLRLPLQREELVEANTENAEEKRQELLV